MKSVSAGTFLTLRHVLNFNFVLRLSLELQDVSTEQQQKEREAQSMLHEMENIEEKYRQNMITLHDAIQEGAKSVTRYETKQVAVLKEVRFEKL